MKIKNNFSLFIIHFTCLLLYGSLLQPLPISSNSAKQDRFDLNGFKLNIIKNHHLDFIHVELMFSFRYKSANPAIPYLAAKTVFTKSLKSKSAISKHLRALGNDYTIEFMGDHVIIKINFLRQEFPRFIRLLSAIYVKTTFSSKELNRIKRDILLEYHTDAVFLRKMALFAAYQHVFGGQILGNSFFTSEQLKACDINKLIIHFKSVYKPENTNLFITGRVNEGHILGSIKYLLRSRAKRIGKVQPLKKTGIRKLKKIVVFNIKNKAVPSVTFLKIIRTENQDNLIPALIINDFIFRHYPININSRNAEQSKIRKKYHVITQTYKHHGLAVISNSVNTSYRRIPTFLRLLRSEIRDLKLNGISRRNFRSLFTFFYGRAQVFSSNHFTPINQRYNVELLGIRKKSEFLNAKGIHSKIGQILIREKEELMKNGTVFSNQEIIVVTGDYDRIYKLLPGVNILKVDFNPVQ